MTATTVPQDLAARSWNGLLKAAAVVALFVVLVAGSFAVGRSTADEPATIVRATPCATTPIASLDMPPVSLHTGVAPVYAVPDPALCGHTANTPPC